MDHSTCNGDLRAGGRGPSVFTKTSTCSERAHFLGAELFTGFLQKAHRLQHAGVPAKAWNLLFKNEATWFINVAESSGWKEMVGRFQQPANDIQLCESPSQHGGKRASAELLTDNNDATCDAQASPTLRLPWPIFEHGWTFSAACK